MNKKRLYVRKEAIGIEWIANSKCKKCYGRGYLGKYVKTELLMPCSCLKPNENQKIIIPRESLIIKELVK